ncbi:MAG: arginine--tRNA ligase [Armatimonadota bacterium]|nr:arginine--tRNA ligase [Armatimonadota bacterium]
MIQEQVARTIKQILGTNEVTFNIPPKREFGDFSTAVCLAQARVQKRPPLEIARDLADELSKRRLPFIREVTVTPPGYVNFKIDHPRYVGSVIERVRRRGADYGRANVGRGRKVLVEHTNVNPNKAMHIGHLRNAVIGDSVVRILDRLGYKVEAANYIDDTGVQVADVVVGMLYLDEPRYDGESEDTSQIWAKYDGSVPFDYWCWDLYARVSQEYETNEELKAKRAEVLHLIEKQNNPVARFAKELATKIVKAHLATVGRLNVYYDLLNWESDIYERGFWKAAFELLKQRGAIEFETEGPNAGCWVVRFGRGLIHTDEGIRSEDKVLVRSNGTVTYTGKDIAYQMWKFGVLGRDFLYKLWGIQPNGKELWTTAPDGIELDRFGRANKVINVIDVRQSYTQQVVYDCLRRVGFVREARNSIHLDYEVVVLSKAAAAELGAEVEDDGSEIQAMSGRKGLGVKGDDLINAMVNRLRDNVRSPENAEILAAAAIRYFMSRISTGKMIVFDFDEALRTTGDTGVYCQYAHARACSILRKAGITGFGKVRVPEQVTLPEQNLVKKIAELPAVMRKAGRELSPTPLARYAFELATAFTDYYERPDPDAAEQVPFIKIQDPVLRTYRLALVDAFRQCMANCLDALGIVPLEEI